jgi:hypothetical protein
LRDWSPPGGKHFQRRNVKVRVKFVYQFHYQILTNLGVRNFVIGITVKVASDEATLRREKTYINKLNLALVQVCQLFLWRRVALTTTPTDLETGVAPQLANVHP